MKKSAKMIIGLSMAFVFSTASGSMGSNDLGGEFEAEIFETAVNPDPVIIANSYSPLKKTNIDQVGLVSDEFAAIYSNSDSATSIPSAKQPDSTPEPASLMIFGIGMVGLAGLARKKLSSNNS